MKRFLLVDDHMVVRSGLKMLLFEIFKPCEIDEAGDGYAAIERLKKSSYDLIIMDIQMPNTDALGLMEFIHIKDPRTGVLIFSMKPEKLYAKRFLEAGAKGFVPKDAHLDDVVGAINKILNEQGQYQG